MSPVDYLQTTIFEKREVKATIMKRKTFAYLFLLFFFIIVLPGISIMSSCHAYASLTVVEVDIEDEEETSSSGQTGDIKYGISSSNFLNGASCKI